MADDPKQSTPVTLTPEQQLESAVFLREAVQAGIRTAANAFLAKYQLPVHPDDLAGVLLMEAATVTLHFGLAGNRGPFEIDDTFRQFCRRARRGLGLQLTSIAADRAAQKGQNS